MPTARNRRRWLALAAILLSGCTEGGPSEPTPNATPTVSLAVSVDSGLQAATAFAFTAQASDPEGDVLSYTWDFGDQTTATGSAVTHVYQAAGSFTARVSVSDGKNTVSGQASVRVKSLTGTWTAPPVDINPSCRTQLILTVVQSGTTLSGTMGSVALSACPATGTGPPNPIAGAVHAESPPVRWTGRVRTQNFDEYFTAEVDPEVSVLSRITIGSCFTHPVTGAETCTSGFWVVDRLTRQ